MVQFRPRYMVGYGPRVYGYCPGNPISSNGVPATCSGVYTRSTGIPERVSYFCFASGCLRRKPASSSFSHCSRCARAFWTSSSSAIGNLPVEIAIVDHPPRLELRPRQRSLREELQPRADAALRLQALAEDVLQPAQVLRIGCVLHLHQELVHPLLARDDDAELAAESRHRAQRFLDGAGIDVLAADDEHVV